MNPNPRNWLVENLRLSLLVSSAIRFPLQENYWSILTDEPPGSHIEDRKKGVVIDQGPFMTGLLSVQVQSNRIDLLLMPDQEETSVPQDGLDLVGSLKDLTTGFQSLAVKLVARGPELHRLAFGSVLLCPVASHEDGYNHLASLLTSVKVDPATSDFLYQVNRRIQSKVLSDWTINRLTKWSVYSKRKVAIQEPLLMSDPVFATRLELDVNNVPNQGRSLPTGQLGEFASELIGAGAAVAEQGEIT